jgi:hypothetical protein
MISKNKILYPIGLSFLLILFYSFFAFLKLENFTMFIVLVLFMMLNQLLSFLLVDTNPKEGLNKVSSIYCLLVTTQLFSVIVLGLYLSLGPIGQKKHFHTEDLIYYFLFFVLVLPVFMTSLIWYFNVRLQKPKY